MSVCVFTWRFQCRGIPRRSGSQGGLGVLRVLRFFALFCGRLPLFCGRFAEICGCSLFLGVCGNLPAFASKTGSMPRTTRNSSTFESPGMCMCMYVCMYVCMYTSTCVRVRVKTKRKPEAFLGGEFPKERRRTHTFQIGIRESQRKAFPGVVARTPRLQVSS